MIMPNNLGRQYSLHAKEYEDKAIEVLRSGWYILGKEVSAFEEEWAKYIGAKYCVGLASGLDALWISFRLLDIQYNLRVVEDCAQSHGNKWKGQVVGSFGDVGCFSFYPSKGCGAFGDAGCITTNDEELAQKFKVFRNYGSRVRYQN